MQISLPSFLLSGIYLGFIDTMVCVYDSRTQKHVVRYLVFTADSKFHLFKAGGRRATWRSETQMSRRAKQILFHLVPWIDEIL
jgi:hypothetical protein